MTDKAGTYKKKKKQETSPDIHDILNMKPDAGDMDLVYARLKIHKYVSVPIIIPVSDVYYVNTLLNKLSEKTATEQRGDYKYGFSANIQN